jgi:hypothetical protein
MKKTLIAAFALGGVAAAAVPASALENKITHENGKTTCTVLFKQSKNGEPVTDSQSTVIPFKSFEATYNEPNADCKEFFKVMNDMYGPK